MEFIAAIAIYGAIYLVLHLITTYHYNRASTEWRKFEISNLWDNINPTVALLLMIVVYMIMFDNNIVFKSYSNESTKAAKTDCP